jgi:transposase
MFAVEVYAAVRRFVFIEGNSRREAARVFGLSRDTIGKMCRFSVPPGYVRSKPPEKPKLGALIPVIDAILEADKTAPPKQRHTAKRIFERLRDEHGFSGGYTVVKDHVRLARTRNRETFVPLSHLPGHAQVDFGESVGVIGGMRMKLHVFCFDLPHSDACFVKAYPAETTEAFLDGHVSTFAFFGGVPLSIPYDNLKIAVARILGDGKRTRTRSFTELLSHYLFDDRFGRPGKGNDKGKVEALVKYTRANFLTPMPHAASFAASTPHWSSVAATAKLSMPAAMRRRLLCGFTLIRQCFVIFLRCPSNHARSVPRRSPPPPWYATEATTIQCRRHLVSATCWSKASSMKSSSSVAPGWSRDILVYTGVASSPSTPGTIRRLSSGNPAHSTRRHRCRAGPCRRACSIYVGCSRRAWAGAASESSSRCCG